MTDFYFSSWLKLDSTRCLTASLVEWRSSMDCLLGRSTGFGNFCETLWSEFYSS